MSKINSVAFAILTVFGVACSEDPITTFDRNTDCADICDKYQECVQGDYDKDDCTTQCKDMTTDDDTQKIDKCQECLADNTSCVDKVSSCTDDCAGIIAKSSN